MNLSGPDILRRLGAGESISSVCTAAGISRDEFDAWWQAETAARVPRPGGSRRAGVRRPVQIERNPWGIPSIYADNDEDLFFGFGYAMAQDRLFQLDFLRRKGSGRLAEVFGADGVDVSTLSHYVGVVNVVEIDLLTRTVGLRRIAEHEWTTLPPETRTLLEAFTAGINAVLEESRGRLPIEFSLLDYEPEPWSPIDSLTIEGEFR
jgi:penicillin amidase